MIVPAAPVLPVGTDLALHRPQRFTLVHGNKARPRVYRSGWHVRHHLEALNCDVAAPPPQGAARQLEVSDNRVSVAIRAVDHVNGVAETPDMLLVFVNGHRSGNGRSALEGSGESVTVLNGNFLVEGVEEVVI